MSEHSSNDKQMSEDTSRLKRGPLAWMAKNSVAANVLMIGLLVGGLLKLSDIKQEVFPEFSLDKIIVQIPYPSASNPENIRDKVLKPAEVELANVNGIKRVNATAAEGIGAITIDLRLNYPVAQAENDVRSAMSRIELPDEARRKLTVSRAENKYQVTSLVFYGEVTEEGLSEYERRERTRKVLNALADTAKKRLEKDPRISQVDIGGIPDAEVSIEIPQSQLRKYGLTIPQVAQTIDAVSVEVPGGKIRSPGGDVNIRVQERRETEEGFATVPILAARDGAQVTVEDIAGGPQNVRDTFEDNGQHAVFNGKTAVMVSVFRVGDEKPLEIASAVEDYIASVKEELPPGFKVAKWMDMSEMYEQRVSLLMRNALLGLILVLLVLGLFLEIRLAFWVTLGIPISFIGALIFLPSTGMSVNMISLFAFIIVLGMVVDDAIIVGEAIFHNRQMGMKPIQAAIYGVKEVAVPVLFAVITTMIAYAPMLYVPGVMGKFFRVVPIVVITVLFMSLIESLLILPAHLAHTKKAKEGGVFHAIGQFQGRFARWLENFIENRYQPFLIKAVRNRGLTIAVGFAIFIIAMGTCVGGRIEQSMFPKLEDDLMIVYAEMAPGSPLEHTERFQKLMIESVEEILEDNGGFDTNVRGLFSQVGISTIAALRSPDQSGQMPQGSHITETALYMTPMDARKIRPSVLAAKWNEKIADFPGLQKLKFLNEAGPAQGPDIDIILRHDDMEILKKSGEILAERISKFSGTREIFDGHVDGVPQATLTMRKIATLLQLTPAAIAQQVRGSFYGIELQEKLTRGDDEVKVFVRLPRRERMSEQQIQDLIIRTPGGGELTLANATEEERNRSYTSITRIDRENAISVQANVDPAVNNASDVNKKMFSDVLPKLVQEVDGLSFERGGSVRESEDTNKSLITGFIMALIGIYALIAIAFRSYLQPVIIMVAIPFGFVGALIGHLLMGYEWSLMSTMGMVALSGVVVNDSLILIVSINRMRANGADMFTAVVKGGVRRFRPILLTSLTTFLGLAPMILETSMQARFLIPMAISLGFGVIFATFITLVLIPALYYIIEDSKIKTKRFFGMVDSDEEIEYAKESI